MFFLTFQIAWALALAMSVGVLAGWLFFGSSRRDDERRDAAISASALASATAPRTADAALPARGADAAELAALREELDAREADVARLRGKLRRAAAELEKRATQVTTARRAHADVSNRLAEIEAQFHATEAERARLAEQAEAALSNPTLWAAAAEERQIQEAVDAKLQTLREQAQTELDAATRRAEEAEARLAETERQLAEADAALDGLRQRATDADADVAALRQEIAELQDHADQQRNDAEQARTEAATLLAEIEAARAEAAQRQRDHELAVSELQIDLSSARLRADAAAQELAELSEGIASTRDESTRHVQSIQERLGAMTTHVDAARATLAGRNPTTRHLADHGVAAASTSETHATPSTSLAGLPGITPELLNHLDELEIRTLAEIADWTPVDVAQYESWLPDHPNVISSNDWVGHARRTLGLPGAGPARP